MSQPLYNMARQASEQAHAPYSGYHVGAVVVTDKGRYFMGCNVENASFPEGWCAETSAIAQMVLNGGGTITELAVYCDKVEKITPCGGCRQRISEFATKETKIHLCDEQGIAETVSLGDLLPKAFDMDPS